MVDESVPFIRRLGLALACLVRILLDGAFAARVLAVRDGMPELPGGEAEPAGEGEEPEEPEKMEKGSAKAEKASEAGAVAGGPEPALVLLALLQREGRLVDFLEQDIDAFDDAEVGAAARVLHTGCRKALHGHAEVEPVRDEEEDSRVEVEGGIDTGEIKLVGQVAGDPPYRGVLKHRGWRVRLSLPEPTAGHAVEVVAPAEVEL